MSRAALLLALAAAAAAPLHAEPPLLSIALTDAEQEALAHSPILKAAQSDLAAAESQVDVGLADLLPRVAANGSYAYQTEVPKISLVPGAPPFQFGTNDVYSIGPSVLFTLWDQGALLKAWRSQKAAAASQQAQQELVRRQVILMARLDYFQVQLALESERSLIDSLRLADAQYRDIDKRFRAGAASRIDWLSAHEQVLDRRRDLRSSQADLAAALRTLFAEIGRDQAVDVSGALDSRVEPPLPVGVSTPTVVVALEPLESVEKTLSAAGAAPVDQDYPQLLVYSRQAESQRLSAQSIRAGQWPRFQLSFNSDYQYPETPLIKSYWQNTAGVSASVPLFEFGRTRSQARAESALADASQRQRDEAYDELLRDWHKARDSLASLQDQEAINQQSVDETAELARLRYVSYRVGGSTILDVETADINAVDARVIQARTRAQALIQLATLDSLSALKERP